MFQFNTKSSFSASSLANTSSDTALPNSYGKIRTLKEDYENMQREKNNRERGLKPDDLASKAKSLPMAEVPIPTPAYPIISEAPKMPELPVTFPAKETPKEKREVPNPLGSQSFFNGKSPFEEARQSVLPQKKDGASPKENSRKTMTIVFSSMLALAVIGGGFYYYWFFIKKAPDQNIVQTTAQTNPVQPSDTQSSNKNLRYLNIDVSLGKNQKALQDLAENFLANAAENDLIEIKILDKNNQPIAPKDLEASLGFSLPAKLSLNLTNDYSLFMKREHSEVRTGAAFKLSDKTGLLDELGQQEKALSSQVLPFYLKGAPAETDITFDSSHYGNADIRYLNFTEPSNTSLDYSILTDKQNEYFLFATSKYTIRSIMDFMWGK